MENDFWYSQRMDNEVINLSKIMRFLHNDSYLHEYLSKHLDEASYVFIVKTVEDQVENIMSRQPSEPAPANEEGSC